ncbi:hypothetical protein FHR50_003870 [Xanthomonas arboricola]
MTRCKRTALLVFCLGLALLGVGLLGLWQVLPLSSYLAGLSASIGGSCILLSLPPWLARGDMRDSTRPVLARRYRREFGVPMALYVVVMLFSRYLLAHVARTGRGC